MTNEENIKFLESLPPECLSLDFGSGSIDVDGVHAEVIKRALMTHFKTLDFLVPIDSEQEVISASPVLNPTLYPVNNSGGMIDWFRGEIPFLHQPLPAGRVLSLSPEGEIDWETVKPMQCEGSHDSSLRIRSTGGNGQGLATALLIDGNLCKFLQGHNIFGSLHLNFLMLSVFNKLVDNHADILKGVSDLALTRHRIKKGDYLVKMLDINFLFDVKNDASVEAWLHAAEMNAHTRSGRGLRDKGTLYMQKHSRRWAFKFYNKFREIKSKSKKHQLAQQLQGLGLEEFTQGKLRAELRLMSLELKDLGLTHGKHFTKHKLIQLFNTYMTKIHMKNNATLIDEQIIKLPRAIHSTYQLWRQGTDLKQMLTDRTFSRHRRLLLQHEIDISMPPQQKDAPNNVIPLMRVIEAVPVLNPDFAYEKGLIVC